jgi:predicted ThiF/HesA family dinucleotide-utilizing enzyme
MDILEVHRGGFKKIEVFDAAKIDMNDVIHRKYGGKVGEYKVSFIKDFFPEKIDAVFEDISKENLEKISGNIVLVVFAGGDTLNLRKKIIEYCKTTKKICIGTNGVFGLNCNVKVGDAKYENGPVEFLKMEEEGHLVVGTGKFIKDMEPITPYSLDKIAEKMVIEALKIKKEIIK